MIRRARVGELVRDGATGRVGKVIHVQEPNEPWHSGGSVRVEMCPGVQEGYWHWYEVLEGEDLEVEERKFILQDVLMS